MESTEAIWIVTRNIFKFALSDNVRRIVTDNLERDIRYRYFLPDCNELPDDEKPALEQMADKSGGELERKFFKIADFQQLVATDYVIINPDSVTNADGANLRRRFLRLPIKADGFWIEVDERSTVNFRERFSKLRMIQTVVGRQNTIGS